MSAEDELIPGVRALDHTADVGFRVRAASWPELLDRAARGLMALIYEDAGAEPAAARQARPPVASPRTVTLDAPDAASLLALWLQELLFLHDVHGVVYEGAGFDVAEPHSLSARVRAGPATARPVREIKGVTYHGLRAAPRGGGWEARVIFDV